MRRRILARDRGVVRLSGNALRQRRLGRNREHFLLDQAAALNLRARCRIGSRRCLHADGSRCHRRPFVEREQASSETLGDCDVDCIGAAQDQVEPTDQLRRCGDVRTCRLRIGHRAPAPEIEIRQNLQRVLSRQRPDADAARDDVRYFEYSPISDDQREARRPQQGFGAPRKRICEEQRSRRVRPSNRVLVAQRCEALARRLDARTDWNPARGQPFDIRVGYRPRRRLQGPHLHDRRPMARNDDAFALEGAVDQFRQIVFRFRDAISTHSQITAKSWP